VKPLDLALLGVPAFLAGSLLGTLLLRVLRGRSLSGAAVEYRSRHARMQEWLYDRNILRFPGVCLVDSVHPWVLGESILLLSLFALCSVAGGIGSLPTSIPAAGVLGTGVFLLSLRNEGKRALLAVQRDLPVACFLLSLLLESGMGSSAAFQETASALPRGALAREMSGLVRARSLGIPRGESLEISRRRVPLEEYHLFLNHVQQGERLGIGLSRSVRELSVNLLESQAHRAETVAQQAAVKMLLPLVLFIFPAVFLIILSPVLLGLWSSLWG